MKRRGENGFTTLEVIAAVAIIAVALIPIGALQAQLARGQARLSDARDTTSAVQNAVAIVRGVNPITAPTGRRALSERSVLTWTSAPISPLRPSVNPAGFEVQLYRVSAEVTYGADVVEAFEVDLVGWRATSNAAP